ncbi:hypothetical protein SEUCBS140593_001599 [Sporothrix eucalyptigena]|uniref:Cyclase n=1 Tax=Sporothrix eucalyptigena TaxID=1812306 RepID=A0ABP0AZJ5_9PEZI
MPLPPTPPFSALPLDKSGPRGNAWGLFGPGDQLGMLNRLTPENTMAAASEIRHGIRVSTDWSLAGPEITFVQRTPLQQHVHQLNGRCINDDVLTFNTQSSSQWDGFRHFGPHSPATWPKTGYQNERLYFRGLKQEDIQNSTENGIDVWVENGGIVGRGVLLDWASWVAAQPDRPAPDLLAPTPIPVTDLVAVAEAQGVTFRPGDILLIRSGLVGLLKTLPRDQLQAYMDIKPEPPVMGVQAGEPLLQWIWEHQFSAVAGDMMVFEVQPVLDPAHTCHEWLIAGWGMPIGELFDMERLAEECKKVKKWTFFFSSVPLKVPGGIASPPNGVAIL